MTTFSGITISITALIGTKGAGTKATYVRVTFIGYAYVESPYTGGASAVKHLGINLQSFQILEVKLLGT